MGIIYVILATFIWAIDTLIRYPLLYTGVSAAQIVFTEHFILTLIFAPLLYKHRAYVSEFLRGPLKKNTIFGFIVIGVFGSALGTLCFTEAFSIINPSIVILLQKFQPFVAFILAHFVLNEKLKKEFLIYATFAVLGGFLISVPDILPGLVSLQSSEIEGRFVLGYILAAAAVLSWGASTVYGKKLMVQGFSETQVMSGRFVLGFIFMLSYVSLTRTYASFNLTTDVNFKIFLMVLLSGLLGMYFYYLGLKQISSRVCAIAELFFPLSAVCVNWIFLDKPLSPLQIAGGFILVVSSTALQIRRSLT